MFLQKEFRKKEEASIAEISPFHSNTFTITFRIINLAMKHTKHCTNLQQYTSPTTTIVDTHFKKEEKLIGFPIAFHNTCFLLKNCIRKENRIKKKEESNLFTTIVVTHFKKGKLMGLPIASR